jgi:hypothetical protein
MVVAASEFGPLSPGGCVVMGGFFLRLYAIFQGHTWSLQGAVDMP